MEEYNLDDVLGTVPVAAGHQNQQNDVDWAAVLGTNDGGWGAVGATQQQQQIQGGHQQHQQHAGQQHGVVQQQHQVQQHQVQQQHQIPQPRTPQPQMGAAAMAIAANAVQTAAAASQQQIQQNQQIQNAHAPAHGHVLNQANQPTEGKEYNTKNQPIYLSFYPTVVSNPTLKSTIDMTVTFLQNSANANNTTIEQEETNFSQASGTKDGMGFLSPDGAGHEYYCAKLGRLNSLGKVPREYTAVQKLVLFKHPEPKNATATSLSVPAMRQQFLGIVRMLQNAASQDTIKSGRNWVENSMNVLKKNAKQVSDYVYYMIKHGGGDTFAQKCHILYVIHDVLQCEAHHARGRPQEWKYIPVLKPHLCWMVRAGYVAATTKQDKHKVLNLLGLWVERGILTEFESNEMRIICEARPDQLPGADIEGDGKVEAEWAAALKPKPAVVSPPPGFPVPAPAMQTTPSPTAAQQNQQNINNQQVGQQEQVWTNDNSWWADVLGTDATAGGAVASTAGVAGAGAGVAGGVGQHQQWDPSAWNALLGDGTMQGIQQTDPNLQQVDANGNLLQAAQIAQTETFPNTEQIQQGIQQTQMQMQHIAEMQETLNLVQQNQQAVAAGLGMQMGVPGGVSGAHGAGGVTGGVPGAGSGVGGGVGGGAYIQDQPGPGGIQGIPGVKEWKGMAMPGTAIVADKPDELKNAEEHPVGIMATMLKIANGRNRERQSAFVPYLPLDGMAPNLPAYSALTERQSRMVDGFWEDEEQDFRTRQRVTRNKRENKNRKRRRSPSTQRSRRRSASGSGDSRSASSSSRSQSGSGDDSHSPSGSPSPKRPAKPATFGSVFQKKGE